MNGDLNQTIRTPPDDAFVQKGKIYKKQNKERVPLSVRLGFGHRRWKKLGLREMLILVIPVAVIVFAVLAAQYLHRDITSLTLEGKPCQYYAGSCYRMQPERMHRTSENKTMMEDREMTSLPIYDEERRVITFPQTMAFYAPRTGVSGRVDYFSQIEFRRNGAAELTRGRESKMLPPGFLYDGEDFYLFLEQVTIQFNGYEIELPAMSYVEAVYSGAVMVFNYETKEFVIEQPWTDVTATVAGQDYTLSLMGDSMTTHDGTRTLLFSRPDLMEQLP